MGGKKTRRAAKQRQRRAVMKKARNRANRYMGARVRQLIGHGKGRQVSVDLDRGKPGTDITMDAEVTFAMCDGVGDCCKNRSIVVEPTDVYRVLHNERARKKFGLEITSDLVSVRSTESTVTPLIYWIDDTTKFPMCAIRRVPISGSEDQVCPFWETNDGKPECILGDDRLSYCKADPVTRHERLNDRRRLSGWTYAINDEPCMACASASEEGERKVVVSDWLKQCDMVDRFRHLDAFLSLVEWVKMNVKDEANQSTAAVLLFDWHKFLMEAGPMTREKVLFLNMGPRAPEEVLISARQIMSGIIQLEEGQAQLQKGEAGDGADVSGTAENK